MGQILIGCSGFDYPDWKGCFYPESLKRQDYLSWYASRFPALELNFSYYQMPRAEQLAGMAERSPGLGFAVKAHQSLTHEFAGPGWRDQAARLRDALAPLQAGGRLLALLCQFPFSFHYQTGNRRYLDELLKALDGLPLAVEFRNRDWQSQRVYEALVERGACPVMTDAPALPGLPLTVEAQTPALGYVRFHGRNQADWWQGNATSRYDYRYSDGELVPWAERLVRLAPASGRSLVFFNNHHKGHAPLNAARLRALIDQLSADGTAAVPEAADP